MALYGLKGTAIEVLQALVPVIVLLVIFQLVILGMPIKNPSEIAIGIAMAAIGLILFLQGIRLGLFPLGEAVGATLPKKDMVWLIIVFALLLGYTVTIAEPALRILGLQVEELTAGAISKNLLVSTVAVGVAVAVMVGMMRIALGIPLSYIVIPAYILALVLTYFAPEEIVAIAFDCGGVTTGPVTVPLILALGVGLAAVLGGRDPIIDGFGLIALASVGPIISVLAMGIIVKYAGGFAIA
ncbi:MAG: DUF1538 domain-containing protein [Methanocellales archaeon]|nr:DUF1538 domain-containing protein [Methanocellales archaeon]